MEDELFLQSLAPSLRRVDPRQRMACKMAIMKAINDFEFAACATNEALVSAANEVRSTNISQQPYAWAADRPWQTSRWQQQQSEFLTSGRPAGQSAGNQASKAMQFQTQMSIPRVNQPAWQVPGPHCRPSMQRHPMQPASNSQSPQWSEYERSFRE